MLKRMTLAESAFDFLKQRIISGYYPAQFQLRQDEIATELGLSRIPLREALLRLEANGLIDVVAHKGGIVRSLSTKLAEEIFELRMMIECDLLEKSIPNMKADDYQQADKALEKFKEISINENSIDNWTELNWQFHLSLYIGVKRPETIKILQNLHCNCDRYIRQQLLIEGASETAHEQHVTLLNYCKDGDVKNASIMLKDHILDVLVQIRQINFD